MSYNGSGTFLINTAGQPVVSGTVISSTAFNALTADLATGLSTAITKDGQTTITANIPMANYKFTGLGAGSGAADSANLSQVQSTVVKLLASVSGADTITAVGSPTVAAYAAGQMFYFVAAGANTGAVTINIDSLGAKSITRDGATALAAGDIQSGEVCVIVYDGTQFQLVNGASQSASIVTENLTVNKATVLNESGGDNDTRIEGDTDANLFFVDASTDRIGVGTDTPSTKFEISANNDGVTANNTLRFTDTDTSTAGDQQIGKIEFYSNDASTPGPGVKAYIGAFAEDTTPDAYLAFATAASSTATERLRIDSAGNLGLGVTPSAWNSALKTIQVLNASISNNGGTSVFGSNVYYDSSYTPRYIGSGNRAGAILYNSTGGEWSFNQAASGTAGNTITFTQAMTLDASGNLGVGITSPTQPLHVSSGTQNTARFQNPDSGEAAYISCVNTTDNKTAYFGIDGTGLVGADAGAALIASSTGEPIILAPALTERARITSGGDFGIGETSPGTYGKFVVRQTADARSAYLWNENASNTADVLRLDCSRNTTNGSYDFLKCAIPGVAVKLSIADSGDVANTNGTYGTISDQKLKQDIADAPSQWDDIKNIRFRKYRFKSDVATNPNAPSLLGVVAQELEQVCPGLVEERADRDDEGNDLGTTTKTVKSSILLMKAAVALQEAMTRIEELEAKVAALEAK